MKKEFDSIELLNKNIGWKNNPEKTIYTAIIDDAAIFVTFDHGVFKRYVFKKNDYFKIEDEEWLIFNEEMVTELPI